MIEKIGWLGTVLLSLCIVPELIQTFTTQTTSLTWGFLLMWFFGLLFTLIFTINKSKKVGIIQVISYLGFNYIGVSILLIFKIKEIL